MELREPFQVEWTLFPQTHNFFQDSEAENSEAKEIMLKLKLGKQEDLQFLEACTLLDPRLREKNESMRRKFLNRLLSKFPHRTPEKINSGCLFWFKGQFDGDLSNIIAHYKHVCSCHYDMKEFGEWALNILSKIPSNALVEQYFSRWVQVQSQGRSGLDHECVFGSLLLQGEQKCEELISFDLWDEFTEWMKTNGVQLPQVRGIRGGYKKKEKKQEAISEDKFGHWWE